MPGSIDGIDNNEYTFNTVIIAPSVEQVREFKVLSGVFSAEFGRGAGVVSVATKSGTQPAARHRVRVPARRRVRRPEFLRAQGAAGRRRASEGSKPPLDRHQFGAAVGGPLVIPGLYDGHNRTFFFADYAGLNEKRGQVFVNTVPTALTRDRRLQRLPRHQRQPDPRSTIRSPPAQSRLRFVPAGQRDQPAVPARSLSRQHDSAGPHEPGRAERREHLSAPNGAGQFQQLHVDGQSRGHRQRRSRDASITSFSQATRSSGDSTGASSISTRRRGRPPAACRRRRKPLRGSSWGPSSPASRTRASPLTAPRSTRRGSSRRPWSTSSVPATPARCRSRSSRISASGPPIRWASAASMSPSSPPGCPTSTSRISPGSPAAGVPAGEPEAVPLADRGLAGVDEGTHQLKFGYRLVDRYPSPFTNTDTRGTINFGRNYTNNPVTNTGGSGYRLASDRLHQQRGARVPARAVHASHPGARPLHPGRLQAQLAIHDQCGSALRDLPRRDRRGRQDRELRSRHLRLIYAGEDGASNSVNKKTQYRNLAPRLGMTYDLLGDSPRFCVPASRSPTSPSSRRRRT